MFVGVVHKKIRTSDHPTHALRADPHIGTADTHRARPTAYERLGTEGGRARSRGACDESSLQPPSCGGETSYKNRQKTDRVAACGHPMVHPLVQALVHPGIDANTDEINGSNISIQTCTSAERGVKLSPPLFMFL